VELKENELKVFYGGGLNEELDHELEVLLEDFGYEMWASGCDVKNVRDLAFDKPDR